ncbi:MAG: choice-of-anchor L domain-containing protein [Bacteroidota bacterium]
MQHRFKKVSLGWRAQLLVVLSNHRLIFYLYMLLLLPFSTFSQPNEFLRTRASSDVERLVKEVFIKGNCANVFNIEVIGAIEGIGVFEQGASTITMDEGIILTSGKVEDAVGPNDDNETTFRYGDFSGDVDLNQIATSSVADAVGIEFDFVPIGNTVSFNYVFASEEYCEFVGSIFNDVFGFFVSGPGIQGDFSDNGINVALIPDTDEFVAINSVNSERNSGLYVKNELEIDTDICGVTFAPQYLEAMEYDGFTIRLKASFEVVPCETYHIRLVVGDVADDKLDSAVFLEAKSFDLGETVTVSANAFGTEDNIVYEACTNGEFIFERTQNFNLEEDLLVDFTIIGDAESGLDYEELPQSILIPAGATQATLPLSVLEDQLGEAIESVGIEIAYDCACIPKDSSRLWISDLVPIKAAFPSEVEVCPGQSFSISPEVVNGIEPLRFRWDVGDTSRVLTRNLAEPSHYVVTVTDACGRRDSNLVEIKIQDPPIATLEGDKTWCDNGEESFLRVDLEGNPPWSLSYDINGTRNNFENISSNPFFIPIGEAGSYQLIQFKDQFCTGIAEDESVVSISGVATDIVVEAVSCPSFQDGSIAVEITSGQPPFTLDWDAFDHDSLVLRQLDVGIYTLNITDGANCRVIQEIEVPLSDAAANNCFLDVETSVYIPNAFSPNNDQNNDVFQVFPASDVIQSLSFQMIDRWGNLLFQSPSFSPNQEDVFWNGNDAGTGVYVCVVELILLDNSKVYLSGDVSLMR